MTKSKRPVGIESIDLRAFPSREAARRAMSQIAPVHDACWPEADIEKLYASRLDVPSVENRLLLAREGDGAVVGFGHAITQDVDVAGTPVRLMRFQTAVLPGWRTTAAGLERLAIGPFVASSVRGLLRGRLPLVFLYLATPSAYRTTYRVSPRLVPSPGVESDPFLLKVRDALIDHLHLERVPGREHACYGPRAVIAAEERAYWNRHTAPEVRFFLRHCPNFGDGEYLPAVIPVTWTDIARVPASFVTGVTREWLRRRRRAGPATAKT
jgi:hypothetical protein